MAGGKETPRQKMVGMMYLVLTALLALQVSSSIIDKFMFLNDSLEHAKIESEKTSDAAIGQIEATVKKEGNTALGRKQIERAKELRAKTKEVLDKIESLKTQLVEESGGYDEESGKIKNPKEETKVEELMIGPEGSESGEGYALEKLINGYVDELNSNYKDLSGFTQLIPLAVGNEDKAMYANDESQKNKNFVQASFETTPVVAALAVLTQLQNEVLRYEQEVLKKLVQGDISKELKFDQIQAVVAAESSVLAPGDEFKAKMYLSASSSNITAKMTFNGSAVPVKQGTGIINIKVQGGNFVDGKMEVPWKGTITFKGKDGKDTTFEYKSKYTVVEPTVLITAGGGKFPIYLQCANRIETVCAALGASYDPAFTVTNGARAIPGPKKGGVTIIPNNKGDVSLSIIQNGTTLKTQVFEVRPVPDPTIALIGGGGNAINLEAPITMVPVINVAAIPDETFKTLLPEECNYQVGQLRVIIFRDGAAIANKVISNGGSPGVQTRKGDQVQIKVESIQRASPSAGIVTITPKQPYISFGVR